MHAKNLLELVQLRTNQATGLSNEEIKNLVNADQSILHDPFLFDGMSDLVDQLHDFKLLQDEHPQELLVIDTDYDTDGIMSAAVLSAALDVFNINYRVYVPSMDNGYGLSPVAIHQMLEQYQRNGYHIHTILTADNGTNAVDGVDEANKNGIHVLVTDHHLGGDDYSNADVIVNPNHVLKDGSADPYPFKGNAGAAVAWKMAIAYATRFEPETLPLIEDLIVFAGMADVSDVMPILDENHYMVKKAVEEINRLVAIKHQYQTDQEILLAYKSVKNTRFPHYNTVFHGLFDMITLLQKSKDDKRRADGKNPIPLATNEELISWYLSPMMNAPRRIHATSKEGMMAIMAGPELRHQNIEAMIAMNAEKTELRDKVVDELDWDKIDQESGTVVFANTQHGISGLVAGQITGRTGKASIVFSINTDQPVNIYDFHAFDDRWDKDSLVISGSARSTTNQPLNVIMARIQEIRPDIIAGGGGHAQAAGYAIYYKTLDDFAVLFDRVAAQVEAELKAEYDRQVAEGLIEPTIANTIRFTFRDGQTTDEYANYNIMTHQATFKKDLLAVYDYEETLRPFGKDFNAQTTFQLELDLSLLQNPAFSFNAGFWGRKGFKFSLYGVDVITFDTDLSDLVKQYMNDQNLIVMPVNAKLTLNEFRGNVNPQLQLSRL